MLKLHYVKYRYQITAIINNLAIPLSNYLMYRYINNFLGLEEFLSKEV